MKISEEMKYRNKIREMKNFLKHLNQLPNYPNEQSNITEIMNGFGHVELNDLFDTLEAFKNKIEFYDFRGD